MYIEQAYKNLHEGWRYIIGFLIVFIIGWQIIGVIPLMTAAFIEADSVLEVLTAAENNFTNLFEGQSNLFLTLMSRLP